MSIAIVTPVYQTAPFLPEMVERVRAAMAQPWTLLLVVDACPDGGAEAAAALTAAHPEVRSLQLPTNVGQHRALALGLQEIPDADAWVCLDSDLQDPPEAIPVLLQALTDRGASAVFAGRRGRYESLARRATGGAHRRLIAAISGVPTDAGAFFALDARSRSVVVDSVLEQGCPSAVVAAGSSGLPLFSVPIARDRRAVGESAWTSRARIRQSMKSIAWSLRQQRGAAG